MSEGFGQQNTSYGYNSEHNNETQARQGLEASAAEFKRSVEEAASRLSSAAEHFVSMTDGLVSSINEAREAAEKAQAAQNSAQELQQRMERDYGAVSGLVRDLQERISALAVLARPLSVEPQGSEASMGGGAESQVPEMPTEGQGESTPEMSNLEVTSANHTEHQGWQ